MQVMSVLRERRQLYLDASGELVVHAAALDGLRHLRSRSAALSA